MWVTWSGLHTKGIICGVWCTAHILQKPYGIWRGTAVRNVILYFFPSLRWMPAFPPQAMVFLQAGHHTCKWFYWNQGIFTQSNSLACYGTPSFESTTIEKSIFLLLSVATRAVTLQPRCCFCMGLLLKQSSVGWAGLRTAVLAQC